MSEGSDYVISVYLILCVCVRVCLCFLCECESKCVFERQRGRETEGIIHLVCLFHYMLLLTGNTYGKCVKKPDRLFLILQDDCVAAGIPGLSGTWTNVLYEILIAIVGGKGKKERKKKLLHFSICFARNQSRWIISWSGAFSCLNQLKSKWCCTCQTHTYTHTHQPKRSHSSRLKYNRLLLINMSKLSRFKKPL